MDISEAADLLSLAYAGKLDAPGTMPFDLNGAQAYLLADKTLVIPGTNEKSDWKDFNFDVTDGDSGRIWHAGFMRHARTIYAFAKGGEAKRVIGHSLGAASAQIIGCSLEIPALCIASPRPLRGKTAFRGEKAHRQSLPLRRCGLLPALRAVLKFRHLGKVHWISPGEPQSEGSHTIADYHAGAEAGRGETETAGDGAGVRLLSFGSIPGRNWCPQARGLRR